MPAAIQNTRSGLGERIDDLCVEHDMTLREMAERLEVNRTTLWKWRSGRYDLPPSIVTLVMLADMCGVSTDWLLGRTDRRRPG